MVCLPQYWDWLENRESQDDEMSRRVWKTVETKVGEVRLTEAKRRRGKRWKGKRQEEREQKRKEK